jgi:hypothetical protein
MPETGEGTTEGTTESTTESEAPATGEEQLGDAGKQALDRMKAERNDAARRARDLEKQLNALREASMSEAEKAVSEAEARGRSVQQPDESHRCGVARSPKRSRQRHDPPGDRRLGRAAAVPPDPRVPRQVRFPVLSALPDRLLGQRRHRAEADDRGQLDEQVPQHRGTGDDHAGSRQRPRRRRGQRLGRGDAVPRRGVLPRSRLGGVLRHERPGVVPDQRVRCAAPPPATRHGGATAAQGGIFGDIDNVYRHPRRRRLRPDRRRGRHVARGPVPVARNTDSARSWTWTAPTAS